MSRCPRCQQGLSSGDKFCQSCGCQVDATGPPPTYSGGPPSMSSAGPPTYNGGPPTYTGGYEPSAPPVGRVYDDYIPSSASLDARRAAEHAECAICFGGLPSEVTAVFTKGGKRVCPHFFHKRCCEEVQRASNAGQSCPLCRQKFDGILEVPNLDRDPEGWFKVVDLNSDHKLSQGEVREVLKAQLPINYVLFEEQLPSLFRNWDADGDGTISKQELMHAETGLINFVRQEYRKAAERIPDIKSEKSAWFKFYDYDKSGTLEKEEVVRALCQTFKLGRDLERVNMMREIIGAVWGEFDHDGSGTIEEQEFFHPGTGLADTLVATLGFN